MRRSHCPDSIGDPRWRSLKTSAGPLWFGGKKFEWAAIRVNWVSDGHLPELHIRPRSPFLSALQLNLRDSTKLRGVFPFVTRPKNAGEGRNYESEFFIFTPKIVGTIINWALDNNWRSSTANLYQRGKLAGRKREEVWCEAKAEFVGDASISDGRQRRPRAKDRAGSTRSFSELVLVRATILRDKGFQWIGKVDGDWIAISTSDLR